MHAFKSLTGVDLILKIKTLVGEEARTTSQVIACLEEIDARRLHLEMGYPSLFEFATRELGYSEPSAYRRINAMRVVRDVPAIRSQVEDGTLPLTTLTQVQRFFNQKRKIEGKPYTTEQKQELIENLVGKSSRECERKLAALTPLMPSIDRARAVSETQTQITFTASAELMADLEKLRQLWGHHGDLNYAELFSKMAQVTLAKVDPQVKGATRKGVSIESPNNTFSVGSPSAPKVVPTRHVPNQLRRLVWSRDGGCCRYTDPQTGRRCGSKFALEVDHLIPFALGGEHSAENLRLLCRNHNAHHAEKTFGAEKMAKFAGRAG